MTDRTEPADQPQTINAYAHTHMFAPGAVPGTHAKCLVCDKAVDPAIAAVEAEEALKKMKKTGRHTGAAASRNKLVSQSTGNLQGQSYEELGHDFYEKSRDTSKGGLDKQSQSISDINVLRNTIDLPPIIPQDGTETDGTDKSYLPGKSNYKQRIRLSGGGGFVPRSNVDNTR